MPTNIDFERQKYGKDLLQPYKNKKVNEEFVKEHGTSAYKETGDLDIKNYYDKKLISDPKLIHSHNSVLGIDIPKGKREKPKGCQHEFSATVGGGLIDGCIKCGFKMYGKNR
jgi:hypothetical protein